MSPTSGTSLAQARLRLDEMARRLGEAGRGLVGDRRPLVSQAAQRLAALEPSRPAERPETPDDFAGAAIYEICGASVTDEVAARTFERCRRALQGGGTARAGFRHPTKADAIDRIWHERERLFRDYARAGDKLAFIAALPGIGTVTKHRLARRLGLVEAA